MIPYDKSRLMGQEGRQLTQSLFLEFGYHEKYALFTLKGEDTEHFGRKMFSLKKLFLGHEDILQYDFATTYLTDWKHWQRIKANKLFSSHIEEWEEELELKLRSNAVRGIIDMTAGEAPFQASKWLADRGWAPKAAGRPTALEKKKAAKVKERLDDEFSGDVLRMFKD